MISDEDLAKHLYYSFFGLLIANLALIVGQTISEVFVIVIAIIIDMLFVLLGIAFLRLRNEFKKENHNRKSTLLVSVLLFISAGIEIIQINLSLIPKIGASLATPPLSIVNLGFNVIYYLNLTIAYLYIRKITNDLHEKGEMAFVVNPFVSIGYGILTIVMIFIWIISHGNGQILLENITFFLNLVARFFIILGYYRLVSIFRLKYQQIIEEEEYRKDIYGDE